MFSRKFSNKVFNILFITLFVSLFSIKTYANEIETSDTPIIETEKEQPIGPGYEIERKDIETISETLEYVEIVSNVEGNSDIIENQEIVEENGILKTNKTNNAIGIDISDKDYENLLHIVEAEATGQDLKGKILIANVIFNRYRKGGYGNITDVIFAKNQFSPIRDGRFWSVPVTDSTREAVRQSLDGVDYSQGALYFMNRRGASRKNASWFDRNLTYLFSYSGHEFFK